MALEIRAGKALFGIVNPLRLKAVATKVAAINPVVLKNVTDTVNLASDFDKYMNFEALSKMLRAVKSDPEISKIAEELKLPLKVDMNIAYDLKDHLMLARDLLVGTFSHLPAKFKQQVNLQTLTKAAIIHDTGKTVLPASIINKKGAYGSFTEYENKVKEFHPVLGEAMLRTTGLDEETLSLVKYHHRHLMGGYPQVNDGFECTFAQQMLHVADEASAMLSKRSYVTPQDKSKALLILENEMNQGKFHPAIYEALFKHLNSQELTQVAPKVEVATKAVTTPQDLTKINPQRKPIHEHLIDTLCSIFFKAQ